MAVKTTCPLSHKEFKDHAKPIEVTINGERMDAPARTFSTGSLGWYVSKKATITINGKPVTVQIGLNMTIVGSKDVPKDPDPAAAAPVAEAEAPGVN
jgi:hypothetical protein